MRKTSLSLAVALLCICLDHLPAFAQGEPFSLTVLNTKAGSGNYRLRHPFDIVYGPDNFLYITEKIGRILRVDTGTGQRQIILDIRNQVAMSGSSTAPGQNGMLGLALHPNFGQGTGHDSIFVAYSYTTTLLRISKFRFNSMPTPSLTGETVLIEGLPASHDHSTGRMIIGGDGKLYYSCGDLGNNQFNNKCFPIRSQLLPTAGNISAENYANYSGKILRMNLDGSIPDDNPLWNGVRSHIYTVGHRNPQGLVWQKLPGNGFSATQLDPAGRLFSSEHGPNTDDEINIIEPGRNYGWPYIAGDTDEVNYQYVQWSTATNCNSIGFVENPYYEPGGATVMQERDAPVSVKNNFKPPLKAVYTGCGSLPALTCDIDNGWLRYPTIAPSSIEFYNLNSGLGIPNWYPSLLVPTLRRGTVYRYKLNAAMDSLVTDSIPYFRSVNRYRDIAVSPDGRIFLITDSTGSTSGPSGQNQAALQNRGAILVYTNTGAILPIRDRIPRPGSRPPSYLISVYPNPATSYINVEFDRTVKAPVRYRLYDITGKLVDERSYIKDNFNIDVSRFNRGMYVFKLYNGYDVEIKVEKVVLR